MNSHDGGVKISGAAYRPDIDGLRALAVVAVLLFHAKLGCPGGFVGVDIFFVISGYLISGLILKDMEAGGFSLVAFWERRIRRILPALTTVVLAVLIASWFFYLPEDFESTGKSAMAQAVLMSNFFFARGMGYFGAGSETKPLLHTWSLAVEEQFYLLFPLLLLLLARFRKISLYKGVLLFVVVSFILSVIGSHSSQNRWQTFYYLPTRAWELLAGALLTMTRGRFSANGLVSEASGWLGLALVCWPILFYDSKTRFPGWACLAPCFGALLIIFSSESGLSIVGRVLAFKPVVFVGLISYSLYLWHWPLLVFPTYFSMTELSAGFRWILIASSFVLAMLSWRFIETPFRKRWIFRQRWQIFSLAIISTSAVFLFGFLASHFHGVPSRFPAQALAYARGRNDGASLNNVSVTLKSAQAGQFPEFGLPGAGSPVSVLIWGDSHAMALTPVLDELCRHYSWRGVEATRYLTPPTVGYSKANGVEISPDFADAVLRFIAQNHPSNVVMTAAWWAYRPVDSFKSNMLSTVRAVLDSGARVYVVEDVPMQNYDIPRHAALIVKSGGDVDLTGITLDDHEKRSHELRETFEQISRMGATVLDPAPYFLNRHGLYGPVKDGQALYRDSTHLSVQGAHMLAPLFEPLFRAD